MRKKIYYIHQWFSTGVPRDSVKGAAGFQFSSPLDVFYHLGVHRVPANIDIADQECRESKKVENHWRTPFELWPLVVLLQWCDTINCPKQILWQKLETSCVNALKKQFMTFLFAEGDKIPYVILTKYSFRDWLVYLMIDLTF